MSTVPTILPRPLRGRGRATPPAEASPALHGRREVALVTAGLLVYFGVRAATVDREPAALAHARSLVHLERTLGIDVEADVQGAIANQHLLVTLANWVYIWGHWPVIAMAAVWLFHRHPAAYREMRAAFFFSGGIAMLIFLGYPVAPPRLADVGLLDTVTRYSHAYRALQPPSLMDRYAALPSLHFGWDLLVGVTLVRAASSRVLRAAGVLMPVLMALAVVSTGNHYVLDVAVGGMVALTGLLLARHTDGRLSRRPAARLESRSAPAP
jgi:hypothetical protein